MEQIEINVTVKTVFATVSLLTLRRGSQLNDHWIKCLGIIPGIDIRLSPKTNGEV